MSSGLDPFAPLLCIPRNAANKLFCIVARAQFDFGFMARVGEHG
jgi:hypothetical protein